MNTLQRTPRHDDVCMTALLDDLIDAGLTRGLLAMQFTNGVSITPGPVDVAALAALRLLDTLPGSVSVAEVIDGLKRRATALSPEAA